MSKWVKCPICGITDMEMTPDKYEAGGYINCVNLACGSNGGGNFDGIKNKLKIKRAGAELIQHFCQLGAVLFIGAFVGYCIYSDGYDRGRKEMGLSLAVSLSELHPEVRTNKTWLELMEKLK